MNNKIIDMIKRYGEENDFSYRCMDYGYKHLLCDRKEVVSASDQRHTQRI